jgi:hypothetical protein
VKKSTIEFECKISITSEDPNFDASQADFLNTILKQYLHQTFVNKREWCIVSVVPKRICDRIEKVTEL